MANEKKPQVEIPAIFKRRQAAIFALARFYAGKSLEYFRSKQLSAGEWWDNKTNQAATRFFSDAFKDAGSVGYFVAHGVDYGVELTLKNNRKNDAITPVLNQFSDKFLTDVRKLYAGN